MKVYLSIDIEGVAGIADWTETEHGGKGYEYFQTQMTNETIACINALKDSGVTEIFVRDAHDTARNINPLALPTGITFIRGWAEEPCDMLAGLDDSFDALLFIGYHSPSRSDANPLSHTLNLKHNHIKINGKIMSEFEINAFFAQSKSVPVIFVSGDAGLCEMVKNQNKNIKTVATKTGLSGAVISRHPSDVTNDIYETTKNAIAFLKNASKDEFKLNMPTIFECEIFFKSHIKAHKASFYPGASLIATDKVFYQSNDFNDVITFIFFVD